MSSLVSRYVREHMNKRNSVYDYLLARKLRCICGYTLGSCPANYRKGRRIFLYYRCLSYQGAAGKSEHSSFISADRLDRYVWEWICDLFSDRELLRVGYDKYVRAKGSRDQDLRQEVERLAREIEEIESRRMKLLIQYEDGGIDRQTLSERHLHLNEQWSDLTVKHDDLASGLNGSLPEWDDLETFVGNYADLMRGASFKQRRKVIEVLDVQGTARLEGEEKIVEITCYIVNTAYSRTFVVYRN
jgi:hypothetical protein